MEWNLDQRLVTLNAGELSEFTLGPRSSEGGPSGLWRAQLGTYWHQQLRAMTQREEPTAAFEVVISGTLLHRGWRLEVSGRIDQELPGRSLLREIKTVTRALPAADAELRAEYPAYFLQLATYRALRITLTGKAPGAELVFVEAGSGLSQSVTLDDGDHRALEVQLEQLVEFLNLRLASRERLRRLEFGSAFTTLRPGQEDTRARLDQALEKQRLVAFEAPTGFGKTGMLLETGLAQLRAGKVERLVYLTSKATGQLQVAHTLHRMISQKSGEGDPVAAWLVRPKSEHCVNSRFLCTRESCRFLADAERNWRPSGLSRFCHSPRDARDIEALKEAGRSAGVCPYEITRLALAYNEVWIGDFNYVFSPSNRGLFLNQPGWDAARTFLIIDEAHNLPQRVADTYSASFSADAAALVHDELRRLRAPPKLVRALDHWRHFLESLRATEAVDLATEEDGIHLMTTVAEALNEFPVDSESLPPEALATLWALPEFLRLRSEAELPRVWWCPEPRTLRADCLDAAASIGATLRTFGSVLLASATFPPPGDLGKLLGVDTPSVVPKAATTPEKFGILTKRETKKVWKQVMSGADLLNAAEKNEAEALARVEALAPWRIGAYDIAFDARVDTRFQQRDAHLPTTARSLAELAETLGGTEGSVAAFFPSYSYALAVHDSLARAFPSLPAILQPRASDLRSPEAWVREALETAKVLFLVLGSSLSESVDLLGGKVPFALVAGPALPEVNAVQRARLREGPPGETKEEAFRRVYQLQGMQRVNQALGRLVRAPGQTTRVVLHCRRFLEPSYQELLAREYRCGQTLTDDHTWRAWIGKKTRP